MIARAIFMRQTDAVMALFAREDAMIRAAVSGEPQGTGAWLRAAPAAADTIAAELALHLTGTDSISGDFQACASLWPVADNALAYVALQHVLDYALEPEEVLAEAVRCMRGHGLLVLTGFRGFSAARFSRSWKMLPPRFSTASSWARACRALGLADVQIQRVAVGWPWIGGASDTGFAARMSKALPNFASVYVLTARKRAIRAIRVRQPTRGLARSARPNPVLARQSPSHRVSSQGRAHDH